MAATADDDLYILVTDLEGKVHRLPALEGWRIMEIIRDSGLPMKAECGGALACATCHVYVDPEWWGRLAPAIEEEKNMMADFAFSPRQTSRLSCQILMRPDLNGLKVSLAPNPD